MMSIPSTLACSLSGNAHTTIAGAGTSDRTTLQCNLFFREVVRLSRSSHEFVAESVDLPFRALIPALAPISWSDPHLSYFGTGDDPLVILVRSSAVKSFLMPCLHNLCHCSLHSDMSGWSTSGVPPYLHRLLFSSKTDYYIP